MALPSSVELVEVGARDGLQSESVILPTEAKVELIRRAAAAGLRRIEAVSFAHPRLVPQMADAEAVMRQLDGLSGGPSLIGLVMNERGLDRALDTGVNEVNIVVPASDGYSTSNQGMSSEAAMALAEGLIRRTCDDGRVATVTLSVAFGDPYDGEVAVDQVVVLARRSVAAGAAEVALGDTIGVAVPPAVTALVTAVREAVGPTALRCHFHDTRRTGLANVYAAVQAGIGVLDTSIGGIGGSPFAPRAGGNVATEDAIAFLEALGVNTEVDHEAVVAAGAWLAEQLGHELPAAHQFVDRWEPAAKAPE